jgi:hypothetical protein
MNLNPFLASIPQFSGNPIKIKPKIQIFWWDEQLERLGVDKYVWRKMGIKYNLATLYHPDGRHLRLPRLLEPQQL